MACSGTRRKTLISTQLRAALLEVALHLDLEPALLGALLQELGVVVRVELHRQRVALAGQRASLARLRLHVNRAARLVRAADSDSVPRLGF